MQVQDNAMWSKSLVSGRVASGGHRQEAWTHLLSLFWRLRMCHEQWTAMRRSDANQSRSDANQSRGADAQQICTLPAKLLKKAELEQSPSLEDPACQRQ